MRFINGIWFDREDHLIYNAVEVGSVAYPKGGSIRALCTTRHVADRGDTLNKPTITVSLSSPCPDIVAATAMHFKGVKDIEARFELFPDVKPPEDFCPEAAADKDGAAVSNCWRARGKGGYKTKRIQHLLPQKRSNWSTDRCWLVMLAIRCGSAQRSQSVSPNSINDDSRSLLQKSYS